MNTLSPPDTKFLQQLIHQGGPTPGDDDALSQFFQQVYSDLKTNLISSAAIENIQEMMNLTPKTMHGFTYLKPNGYAGCFEIIDRIYQKYHSPNPELYNWDRYWQNHPAAHAVRNRKQYFIQTIHRALETKQELRILNVASGPGRDMFELFDQHPDLPVTIHCIEQDERAIAYASRLCEPFLDRITFQQANALRFSSKQEFDLVWSAGLFDYLNDGLFTRLLRRFGKNTKSGGEIIIGNFSDINPSRAYMELMEWVLMHRSPEHLLQLAHHAAIAVSQVEVCSEELGVNLFLHLRKA